MLHKSAPLSTVLTNKYMHLQYYNYLLCKEDQFPLQMTVEDTYAIAGKKGENKFTVMAQIMMFIFSCY